jgi:hypothetical protein
LFLLLSLALLTACGASSKGAHAYDGKAPDSDTVRRISGWLENGSRIVDREQRLWVIAFDAGGWFYPKVPLGNLSDEGALMVELPAELLAEQLQPLTHLCGSGLRLSAPDAAALITPFLVSTSQHIVVQASGPAVLTRPAFGDALAFRIYIDRPVRAEGVCSSGPLRGGRFDLDLHRGWNLLIVELAGVPLWPTPIVWTGEAPDGLGWYVADLRVGAQGGGWTLVDRD